MQFTYDAYINMLSKLRDKGYIFSNYNECRNLNGKIVILRHDIDYSLDKAVAFAELEAKMNVSSTYFVLLTSEFYNMMAKGNIEKIVNIKRLGHDIGLHFDETNYSRNYYNENGGIKNVIVQEIKWLSEITGIGINSVSMHRPSKKMLNDNIDLSPIVNSYEDYFFKGFKYVSDSRRNWRENIDEIIESGAHEKLHILTHAFWYSEKESDLRETILNFIKAGNIDRFDILNVNITDLDKIVSLEEVV